MSDKEKKTLGLSGRKLGINLGDKATLQAPNKIAASQTISKGKVVVVTKAGKSAVRPSGSSTSVSGAGGEIDKRLAIIKAAELQKQKDLEELKRREERLKKLDEQQNTIKIEQEIAQASFAKEPEEEVVVEVKPQEEVQESAPSRKSVSIDVLLKRGKVKNLDSLYRPEPKPQPVAEEPQQVAKKAFPSKFEPKKVVQAPSDDNFEQGNKKDFDRSSQNSKKFSVSQVMTMDMEEGSPLRRRSLASIRRSREKAKRKMMGVDKKQADKLFREVNLPDFITVQELANRMTEKTSDVIKSLMKLGLMVTVNQSIDADTAELVVTEFGHKVKRVTEHDIEQALLNKIEDTVDTLETRAPVVTIMGHVDHGKTSLLDALRNTDVAQGEAGGITQHIGAYQVQLSDGKIITFLDTPGHEAFTAMRMRGAKVTDVVVLVVAADDGIMQQTVEAISHAKAANVPIIVAINKIDKPDANVERVKNELLSHNILPDDMGGDTMVIGVSAKQKLNLDKLEEAILLQAEMLDLKANINRTAEGAVVEAKIDKGRGIVATLLVQKGTLRVGDMVVAGSSYGKIRALINDKGKHITEAGPSTPVEVLGLESAPVAGDEFTVVANDKAARDLVAFRTVRDRQKKIASSKPASLDSLFKKAKDAGKELPIIVKADVQGSVEAIVNSLQKLNTDEISCKVLHSSVGGITESDITLASASQAIVLGFNVRANNQARDLARVNGIEIKYYSIIYNLVDDIKAAMSGMLSPVVKENFLGYADVRQVFDLSKFGKVAGCYVTEGQIKRHASARIIRDNVVIYEGKLKALKRFKDDVKEVAHGFECGLSFENYEDIKPGDKIEAFELISEQRTL